MKPLIASAVFGVLVMFTSLTVRSKSATGTWAAFLLAVLLGINILELCSVMHAGGLATYYGSMLQYSTFSLWFTTLMTGATLLYALLSRKAIERVGRHVAEYYALIFFILCGVNLLSSFGNMLILFLGIEILSIPQYILAGSDKRNLKSTEASLKYFLMGAFSTGIMLMGIALLYGAMGTFAIDRFHFDADHVDMLALCGILLLIVALGFKVSAAPMHFWTPDVYDGSPTPFTAFMATIVKVSVFVAFVKLFMTAGFTAAGHQWVMVMAVITALTLLVGNITAVFQQSVKRMLAYSSIAQAGFMFFAVLANNRMGQDAIIVYAVAYSVATIGMFAVLMKMKDYTFDGFNGLAKKDPMLAFAATLFMLSMAGIPLTAGFFAKWYALNAALHSGYNLLWLVVFGLVMAAVSAYYYFKVIIAMYFKSGDAEMVEAVTPGDRVLLAVAAASVLVIGVAPDMLLVILPK